jgi:hypothetical protein
MLNVHCHICILDKPILKCPNAKYFITKEQPTFIIQQLIAEILGTSVIVEVVPTMPETKSRVQENISQSE